MIWLAGWLAGGLLLACAAQPAPELVLPERPLEPLEVGLLLRRVHLDLTGSLPSEAQLVQVRADPDTLPERVDELLDAPGFSSRFQQVLAEQWLTRVDHFQIGTRELELPGSQEHALAWSIGTEPLALMAWVAEQDLAWTETVTSEYTLANDMLLSIWPLEAVNRPSEGPNDWVLARYTDGRPQAGVASTNGLWWRYTSTPNNFNRSRAAALSKLLLCQDYLVREVRFDAADLAGLDPLLEATVEVPACRSCHVTLDPIAAAFFGYWWYDLYDPIEAASYHPEREHLGRYFLDTEPAWFGVPTPDPGALLAELSADPRFARCAVERTARAYWRRDPELQDFETLAVLEQDFLAQGQSMKGLIRGVMQTPEYQAGAMAPDAGEHELRTRTVRVMSPDQLAASVEQLTGLRWTREQIDAFEDDTLGLRTLAGGVDGVQVTEPLLDPGLSRSLVLKRLAQAAASYAVSQGTLLVTPQARPGEQAFESQLQRIAMAAWGREMDAQELSDCGELFGQVAALSSPEQAWASVLAGVLRHPSFWSY